MKTVCRIIAGFAGVGLVFCGLASPSLLDVGIGVAILYAVT